MDNSVSPLKARVVEAAVRQKLISTSAPYISLVDYKGIDNTVGELVSAFPDHFFHTYAVKANAYVRILERIREAGMGAEVASEGEYRLSQKAGFQPGEMVFDSPIKTHAELEQALADGVQINLDNFEEFQRVVEIKSRIDSCSRLGFRINPQVGGGSVSLTSTATQTSKFGIGLDDPGNRAHLIELHKQHDWLNCLHVHVGSIGCPLPLMAKGIGRTLALLNEINTAVGWQQIHTLDMGGGLPVNITSDDNTPHFADYADELRANVPQLFSGELRVMTEFGRSIIAKNAMSLARVEYSKSMGGRPIAVTHAGAQSHIRTVMETESWARRVSPFTASGQLKQAHEVEQDVAGPCCFAGDVVAHQRKLASLDGDDLVLIHDTGAYCFANHFLYNCLPMAPVYGFEVVGDDVQFECIHRGMSIDELMSLYSPTD